VDLDPRTRTQIHAVVDLVRRILGNDLVAAYLSGSAVLGGLRPSSDIDILAVSRRPTTPDDKRALGDRLLRISGRHAAAGPARSIELTIAVQADVRPWRYPPLLDFQYGDWLRSEFERGDIPLAPQPNPDLAILMASVLLVGEPLIGSPPAEVLDAIPPADVDRAVMDGIPGLLEELESDTRNVILTLARIWTTVATGEIRPKDAAADWVLARLPEEHRAVLARARAIYLGEEAERWDDLVGRIRPYAEYVVDAVSRLRSGNGRQTPRPA
jgi:predicted nucleotidyltransferase